MEVIKIIEDVTSDSITIKNLSRFKGKKPEIPDVSAVSSLPHCDNCGAGTTIS